MYLKSPMEKYNKNNPFIIIAKKVYDNIVDGIHDFSKKYVKLSIINGILSIIAGIMLTFSAVVTNNYFLYVVIAILAVLNILSYNGFKKTLKYFMSDHHAIQEFSRLSGLEVNDILTLNNEDLLKCIHNLYFLYGELTTVKKYHFFSGSIHYTTVASITAIIVMLLVNFGLPNM